MTLLPTGGPVPAGVLASLLPPQVTAVDTFHDSPEPHGGGARLLFPQEEALVSAAVAKRRHEFATVRHCARTALASFGLPPAPVLPGPRGAPQWPDGMVGSLTHCAGYRAAAVARDTTVAALGIDAEPAEPLRDEGVLRLVTLADERTALRALAAHRPGVPWDRLLFSAKESVYKAWSPLTGRWLGFHDARVTLRPDGTFTADLLVPGATRAGTTLTGFDGRWQVRDGLAVTAVTVPPEHGARTA
ncbi:4'-phosphopantetheinyl transferase superfamily protein [Streptomyces albidochromogenes]|uniref:4'-phosphopantetheinyl transferase family protein n=1 Tax=Streptomyces albidochromogenes TaxID=329524 RepID=UPI00142F0467|nr:4'-phosphopantetheinyl transferase superfamily protein [Streptomyces albidochromogenes]